MTKVDFNQFQANGLGEIVNSQIASLASNSQSDGKFDERLYYPILGKNGEPRVVVFRFLPSCHLSEKVDKDGKKLMFSLVKQYRHTWEVGNNTLTMTCPNQKKLNGLSAEWLPCPICDSIRDMWDAEKNSPEYKEYVEKKRKLRAYANIYIYTDSLEPENNGKVKVIVMNNSKTFFPVIDKWINGVKDKQGTYIDNPKPLFDLFKGHDLRAILTKDGEYISYSFELLPSSKFSDGNQTVIAEKFSQTYDLYEWIDEKNILSPEKMNEKIQEVYAGHPGQISTVSQNASLATAQNAAKKKEEELNKEVLPGDKTVPPVVSTPVSVAQTATEPKKETTAPAAQTALPKEEPKKTETVAKPEATPADDFDPNKFFN